MEAHTNTDFSKSTPPSPFLSWQLSRHMPGLQFPDTHTLSLYLGLSDSTWRRDPTHTKSSHILLGDCPTRLGR